MAHCLYTPDDSMAALRPLQHGSGKGKRMQPLRCIGLRCRARALVPAFSAPLTDLPLLLRLGRDRWRPERLVGARAHFAAPKRAATGMQEADAPVAAQAKVGAELVGVAEVNSHVHCMATDCNEAPFSTA